MILFIPIILKELSMKGRHFPSAFSEADSTHRTHFKTDAFAFLKVCDNFKKIPGLRVALRAQHAHQTLG